MVKIILNSFLFWGGWIIIPFIMEIVPALGSVFLLIRRNLRHKLHKKELEVYPEITLIIPVYNSADTLYGCIRSINDSTYPNDRIRIFLVNNKGKDITVRGIELIIKNVIDKACLKVHVSPHTFRHTFATHMLSNGCPLKSVQELLGHASLSSTEIYTHITDDYIKSEYLKNMPRR